MEHKHHEQRDLQVVLIRYDLMHQELEGFKVEDNLCKVPVLVAEDVEYDRCNDAALDPHSQIWSNFADDITIVLRTLDYLVLALIVEPETSAKNPRDHLLKRIDRVDDPRSRPEYMLELSRFY